jgi:DNA-binding NarL/FixJ family response regulator
LQVGGDAQFVGAFNIRTLHEFVQSTEDRVEAAAEPVRRREKQVRQLIADGKTSKEVAPQLNLSTRTMDTYRIRLKKKLNARNFAELLKRAREQRLL